MLRPLIVRRCFISIDKVSMIGGMPAQNYAESPASDAASVTPGVARNYPIGKFASLPIRLSPLPIGLSGAAV